MNFSKLGFTTISWIAAKRMRPAATGWNPLDFCFFSFYEIGIRPFFFQVLFQGFQVFWSEKFQVFFQGFSQELKNSRFFSRVLVKPAAGGFFLFWNTKSLEIPLKFTIFISVWCLEAQKISVCGGRSTRWIFTAIHTCD